MTKRAETEGAETTDSPQSNGETEANRDLAQRQLELQAGQIGRLQQPRTDVIVNVNGSPNDAVREIVEGGIDLHSNI